MEVKYNIRYSMEDNEFDFIELKLSSNSLNKKEISQLHTLAVTKTKK